MLEACITVQLYADVQWKRCLMILDMADIGGSVRNRGMLDSVVNDKLGDNTCHFRSLVHSSIVITRTLEQHQHEGQQWFRDRSSQAV